MKVRRFIGLCRHVGLCSLSQKISTELFSLGSSWDSDTGVHGYTMMNG